MVYCGLTREKGELVRADLLEQPLQLQVGVRLDLAVEVLRHRLCAPTPQRGHATDTEMKPHLAAWPRCVLS